MSQNELFNCYGVYLRYIILKKHLWFQSKGVIYFFNNASRIDPLKHYFENNASEIGPLSVILNLQHLWVKP